MMGHKSSKPKESSGTASKQPVKTGGDGGVKQSIDKGSGDDVEHKQGANVFDEVHMGGDFKLSSKEKQIIYDSFDHNHDGNLSKEEMSELVLQLYDHSEHDIVSQSKDNILLAGLAKRYTKLMETLRKKENVDKAVEFVTARLDLNHDGLVEKKEFADAFSVVMQDFMAQAMHTHTVPTANKGLSSRSPSMSKNGRQITGDLDEIIEVLEGEDGKEVDPDDEMAALAFLKGPEPEENDEIEKFNRYLSASRRSSLASLAEDGDGDLRRKAPSTDDFLRQFESAGLSSPISGPSSGREIPDFLVPPIGGSLGGGQDAGIISEFSAPPPPPVPENPDN